MHPLNQLNLESKKYIIFDLIDAIADYRIANYRQFINLLNNGG